MNLMTFHLPLLNIILTTKRKRERNYSELNRHGDGLEMWIQVVSVPWSRVETVVCTSVLTDRRQSAMACFLKMLVGALGRRVTAQCGELCGGCERMACSASVWGEVTRPLMHSRAVTRSLKGC